MAPPEPPSELTIRAKVPPGHIANTSQDEFLLGAFSSALPVAALRQRIQTLIPGNPAPAAQRILYGGHALVDDSQTIADALNIKRDPSQTEYVVHLLIRNGAGNAERAGNAVNTQTSGSAMPIAAHELPEQTAPPSIQPNPNVARDHAHAHHHHHHHVHAAAHAHAHGVPNPFVRPLSGSGFHMSGVAPDGQRFSVQSHTTINGVPQQGAMMPGMPPVGLNMPFPGLPIMPGFPTMPMPGMSQNPPPQPSGVSALERARENMTEMRRMLETLRSEQASEATRAHVADIEQRMQAVNDYIDPFHLGRRPSQRSASPSNASAPPRAAASLPIPGLPPHFNMPLPGMPAPVSIQPPPAGMTADLLASQQQRMRQAIQAQQFGLMAGFQEQRQHMDRGTTHPSASGSTNVYLLSSPTGPQALLFSPEYGHYRGNTFVTPQTPGTSVEQMQLTQLAPTPTQPAQDQPAAAGPAPVVAAEANPAQAQLAAPQQPAGVLQPLFGHMWLLIRVMIFAYFLLGSNMGWRRPLALALIGLGFYFIRLGLFANNGIVRRWWDGLVRIEAIRRPDPAEATGVAAEGQGATRMPTPQEVAERLIREQRQRSPIARFREQARPAERALALFVASLWPGIGERYVQALDRARDEEQAARRAVEAQREEAERQAQEARAQAEKKPETAEISDAAHGAEAFQITDAAEGHENNEKQTNATADAI